MLRNEKEMSCNRKPNNLKTAIKRIHSQSFLPEDQKDEIDKVSRNPLEEKHFERVNQNVRGRCSIGIPQA
jgi:hypothetical protein